MLIRVHIGYTASAKYILNLQGIGLNRIDRQENTTFIGHCTLVTTAVDVTYSTCLQVPFRTDGHRGLVIATKHTGKIECIAGQVTLVSRKSNFFCQGCQFRFICCYVIVGGALRKCRPHVGLRQHGAVIVNTDRGIFRHCRIVTTTIEVSDTATQNLQISLAQFRLRETDFASISDFHGNVSRPLCRRITSNSSIIRIRILLIPIDVMSGLPLFWRISHLLVIVVVTITSTKKATDNKT